MSADLRGFRYDAEPVLRRREWQLEATVVELGAALADLAEAQRRLTTLETELRSHVEGAGRSDAFLRDPGTRARSLLWLAGLQGRIATARREVRSSDDRRDEVAARLRTLQGQVEALQAHRADARDAFGVAALAQESAEADRDWLARRQLLDRMGTTS